MSGASMAREDILFKPYFLIGTHFFSYREQCFTNSGPITSLPFAVISATA
jgi:hypothetical protein